MSIFRTQIFNFVGVGEGGGVGSNASAKVFFPIHHHFPHFKPILHRAHGKWGGGL